MLAITYSRVRVHLGLAAQRLLRDHLHIVGRAIMDAGSPGRFDVGCSASLLWEWMSVLVLEGDKGR